MEAIREQAVEDAVEALAACRLDEGSATDALRRLCAAWLGVAERYALAEPRRSARSHVLSEPLIALLERGQAAASSPASRATVDGARVRRAAAGRRNARDRSQTPDTRFSHPRGKGCARE